MTGDCTATRLLRLLLLLLLLALATAASSDDSTGRRWQPLLLPGGAGQQSSVTECGREFRDLQSKWLQSPIVFQARWTRAEAATAAAARAAGSPRRFNLTLTVRAVLKVPPSAELRRQLRAGRRVLVGEFSVGLGQRRQRRLCAPAGRRTPPRNGTILFLRESGQPGHFLHSFLPVRASDANMEKMARVACTSGTGRDCPYAPVLQGGIRTSVLSTKKPRAGVSLRLTCRATGRPLPRPRWMRDGRELQPDARLLARVRKRGDSISTRLVLRLLDMSRAGDYSCQFSNLNGTVADTLSIGVADIAKMGQTTSTQTTPSPTYLCDAPNMTHCMNGGTCVVNRLDNRPHCICPPLFSGYICEKYDASLMHELIERGYARDLASAGVANVQSSTAVSIAMIAALCLVVALLIGICYLACSIRRRLDYAKGRKRHMERSTANKEVQVRIVALDGLSGVGSSGGDGGFHSRTGRAAGRALDASTLTERPLSPHRNERRPQQPAMPGVYDWDDRPLAPQPPPPPPQPVAPRYRGYANYDVGGYAYHQRAPPPRHHQPHQPHQPHHQQQQYNHQPPHPFPGHGAGAPSFLGNRYHLQQHPT